MLKALHLIGIIMGKHCTFVLRKFSSGCYASVNYTCVQRADALEITDRFDSILYDEEWCYL